MSDPRYVIAQVNEERYMWAVKELPAAEHVHVTRHPNGTLTAVPMRSIGWWDPRFSTAWSNYMGPVDQPFHGAWVDCPTGVDIEEPA